MNDEQSVEPALGQQLRVISDTVTFMVTASQSDRAFAIYSSLTPPGAGMPPHRHWGFREFHLIVAGEYTFLRSETILTARPGDMIAIRAGEIHSYTNTGRAQAEVLVIAMPGLALERFYRATGVTPGERGDTGATGPPDIRRFIAVAAAHGIELMP